METLGTVQNIENYRVQGKVDSQLITVDTEEAFQFKPGQYVMLSENGFKLRTDSNKLKWTAYSISSPPGEMLEFVYTIKYNNGFTEYLAENLMVGSVMGLKGPYGKFVLEENKKEKIFVATGAGIAPILSMARSHPESRMKIFYGFRTKEHFLCQHHLEKLAALPNVELLTTCSRDSSWEHQGYVQEHLKKQSFNPQKQEVYVCGSPDMVKEVTQLFLDKGFSKEQVKTEQW